MGGGEDDDLIENHNILNDLCHQMDPTRLTTMAVVLCAALMQNIFRFRMLFLITIIMMVRWNNRYER